MRVPSLVVIATWFTILAASMTFASRAGPQAFEHLPLRFEAQRGQFAPSVDFRASVPGAVVALGCGQATIVLEPALWEETWPVVRLRFAGGDPLAAVYNTCVRSDGISSGDRPDTRCARGPFGALAASPMA